MNNLHENVELDAGPTYGAIAFLDILGFKGAWRKSPPEVIADQMKIIPKTVEYLFKKVFEDISKSNNKNIDFKFNKEQCAVEIISDTFVVSIKENDPINALTLMSQLISDLISAMMFPKLMLKDYYGEESLKYYKPYFMRGAISYGWFYSYDRVYIGEAVDDVAEWYNQPELIGSILTPHTRYVLDAGCDTGKLHRLIKYKTKTKKGDTDLLCVDWPSYCAGLGKVHDDRFDLKQEISRLFSEQGPINQNVNDKYTNTMEFIDFCLQ